jgi:hypothetical protein
VEIDESVAKRKYHRKHRVVERIEAMFFFVMRVPWFCETILELIQKTVHPGSIIYCDCWAEYETEEL